MRSLLLVALLASTAGAEGLTITGESNIAVGAVDVGAVDGFAAPVGHFNLGASFQDLRIQGELDTGLWTTDQAPEADAMSGSYKRLGWAARYYWMNLDTRRAGKGARQRLRLYVESGLGRQWISASSVDGPRLGVSRNDLALGFGMAQEARVGPVVLGGHFGLRIHVADAPQPRVLYAVCRGPCATASARSYDVALFFVLGFVVGR